MQTVSRGISHHQSARALPGRLEVVVVAPHLVGRAHVNSDTKAFELRNLLRQHCQLELTSLLQLCRLALIVGLQKPAVGLLSCHPSFLIDGLRSQIIDLLQPDLQLAIRICDPPSQINGKSERQRADPKDRRQHMWDLDPAGLPKQNGKDA